MEATTWASTSPRTDTGPYAAGGATWWLTAIDPEWLDVDPVRGIIRDGPR